MMKKLALSVIALLFMFGTIESNFQSFGMSNAFASKAKREARRENRRAKFENKRPKAAQKLRTVRGKFRR